MAAPGKEELDAGGKLVCPPGCPGTGAAATKHWKSTMWLPGLSGQCWLLWGSRLGRRRPDSWIHTPATVPCGPQTQGGDQAHLWPWQVWAGDPLAKMLPLV